jgi:hypothetical protein
VIAPRRSILQDVDPAALQRNLTAEARQIRVPEENVSVAWLQLVDFSLGDFPTHRLPLS